jgi:hypothetical protein
LSSSIITEQKSETIPSVLPLLDKPLIISVPFYFAKIVIEAVILLEGTSMIIQPTLLMWEEGVRGANKGLS